MKFELSNEELVNLDKNEIILKAMSFIKYIAKKVLSKNYYLGLELDELVSYGVLGLIESLDRFDTKKNNKFKTFAEFRIKGAMLDYIRSLDKTPRSVRDKEKLIENAKNKVENKLISKASNKDIAEELGLDLSEYYQFLNKSDKQRIINLEDYLENSYNNSRKNLSSLTTDGPETILSKEDKKNVLEETIKELSTQEQTVLDLYYKKELNLKEISYILQISESRISQINKTAIKKLRDIFFREINLEEVL